MGFVIFKAAVIGSDSQLANQTPVSSDLTFIYGLECRKKKKKY